MKKKKQILTPEQKAQKKIYQAKYYQDNKEEKQRWSKEWQKKNPGYIRPCKIANPDYHKEYNHKHDLGYWIVYIITDYNGLGNDYCGMTQNIYVRMANHKSIGRLNTDTYTIVKKCDSLEDALEIESAVHNFGYHGDCRTESGK